MAAKAKTSKRELIDTGKDKRYLRRNEKGQFDEVVDVGRSLGQDVNMRRRQKFQREKATGRSKTPR